MDKIKVIPCSGIGKVLGLIARESALTVTERLCPDKAETVCLAHLVTGEDEATCKVKGLSCLTIDGCPALCAAKSVETAILEKCDFLGFGQPEWIVTPGLYKTTISKTKA